MKILLVARYPVGGIRTYIRYVYNDRVMSDTQVSLIAPQMSEDDLARNSLESNTVACLPCGSHVLAMLWSVLINAIRQRPDIIHSHGFTSAFIVVWIAKILRLPHVVTLHDVFLPPQFAGIKGKFKKWVVGKTLGRVDIINPVGEDAAQNLNKVFPGLSQKSQITTIRNGVDSACFLADDRRDLRQELGIDKSTVIIGFFGRFMAQKGFSLLRDAIDLINKSGEAPRVCVVCFGWGGFIREEQQMLRTRSIEHFFHFLPGTNDMVSALRGVDLVAMPSRWEACPLLPMEAMIAGTVIVTSDCIGMGDVTDNSPAVRFATGQVDALRQAITQVLEEPETYRSKAAAFRKTAAARFDVSETAKAMHELYTSYQGKPGYSS